MDHFEQENHKLREEVTTLQAENEILKNLVSLMTVAQSQRVSLPIVRTQAQTVASTIPISTVFASTPQHAMLEGYLWSTPLNSGEVLKKTIIGKTHDSLITIDDELIEVSSISKIELA